jgi:hypothetical protein
MDGCSGRGSGNISGCTAKQTGEATWVGPPPAIRLPADYGAKQLLWDMWRGETMLVLMLLLDDHHCYTVITGDVCADTHAHNRATDFIRPCRRSADPEFQHTYL